MNYFYHCLTKVFDAARSDDKPMPFKVFDAATSDDCNKVCLITSNLMQVILHFLELFIRNGFPSQFSSCIIRWSTTNFYSLKLFSSIESNHMVAVNYLFLRFVVFSCEHSLASSHITTSLSLKSSLTFFHSVKNADIPIADVLSLFGWTPMFTNTPRTPVVHYSSSKTSYTFVTANLCVCACMHLTIFTVFRSHLLPWRICFWLSPHESFPNSLAWRGRTQLCTSLQNPVVHFTAQRLQFQYSPGGTQCTIFSHMLTRCDARSTCSTRHHSTWLARTIRSSMRSCLLVLL